jgi:hypothetical protein
VAVTKESFSITRPSQQEAPRRGHDATDAGADQRSLFMVAASAPTSSGSTMESGRP